MGPQSKASASRLAQAIMVTALVVLGPAAIVLALHVSGAVVSPPLLVAIGVALSVAVSNTAAAWWKRRRAPGDLLFGELMIWGWLRRRRFERLLAQAGRLLGEPAGSAASALDSSRRARLLERLSSSLEASDAYTLGHSRRVARHSAAIARRMGLSREEVARIRTAAAIHDVGKIEVPAEILRKPAALTDEEYETVKQHAAIGARMAAPLGDEELTGIVRHHHERLNGKGYPDGLAGEEIPLGAKIVAVADTFDALTSERPYRVAMSHRKAFALLGSETAGQLDADVVRAFRSHYGGVRPVAVWAFLVNGGRQLLQPLIGRPGLGGAAGTAKVAAASLATVALSGAALQADDGRRAEAGPLTLDPVAGWIAAPPRAEAASPDPAAAPRDRRRDSAQPGPRGRAPTPMEDGGDTATDGVGAEGDFAGTAPGDRPQSPPPPTTSRPKETAPDPVRDAVRTVEGTVAETVDGVVEAVPPLDSVLPEVPDVELPRLPRTEDIDPREG